MAECRGTGWTEAVTLAAAYAVAVLATPAGISGAVLLLPFQVSAAGILVIAIDARCLWSGPR